MEDAELSLGKLEEVGAAGGSWGKLVEKSLLQTLNRIARTRATNRGVDKPYTKKISVMIKHMCVESRVNVRTGRSCTCSLVTHMKFLRVLLLLKKTTSDDL